jgi:hypothetical protein
MAINEWSTTAGNNGSGVTGVNWAEGMPPSAVNDSARAMMADVATWYGQASGKIPEYLTSIAGTNTITAAGPAAMSAYAAGQRFTFIPANNNSGATTLNITPSGGSALTAKNVFFNGGACVGGELKQNVPCIVLYDGTQFNIVANGFGSSAASTTAAGVVELLTQAEYSAGTDTTRVPTASLNTISLGTETASTSGTSIDFTGIPAGTRRIVIMFAGVSTSGTSGVLIQIGDAGGIENSGYLGATGDRTAEIAYGAGFYISVTTAAAHVYQGQVTLNLESSTSFRWTAAINTSRSDATAPYFGGGTKALSAELDRVRITTAGGADTFDLGAINIQFER